MSGDSSRSLSDSVESSSSPFSNNRVDEERRLREYVGLGDPYGEGGDDGADTNAEVLKSELEGVWYTEIPVLTVLIVPAKRDREVARDPVGSSL